MREPFVFDPRCDLCKEPFGAVVCEQDVTFRCRPLASEHFTRCTVVLHQEFANKTQETELKMTGVAGDRIRFSGTVSAPKEPDLVWYHFRFWQENGDCYVLDNAGYHKGGSTEPWQLTVYRESHTPQWFGAGLTYQIFPDRFCRIDIPDPKGMIGDRLVHQKWEGIPEWRPDEKGEIRNRDFYGGSLRGAISKLDYLQELGVTTLYFCPIFEAASNHRYNTADYTKVDPMLGTEEDFRELCRQAKSRGMKVILDGVFNHIGSQSRYFNADGYYPTLGAAQSKDSPWYHWFRFKKWPTDYESWWGIKTLPAVEESAPSYVDYIIESKASVVRRWLEAGADGWRLDVADELPDWFIEKLRKAVDETKPDCLVLGEVWEDGTTKIAYNERRKYLLGSECHGLMNYPFRTSLIDYLTHGDAHAFFEAMESLRENYPPAAFYSAMNFLGTHDTPRILTMLGAEHRPDDRAGRAAYRLSPSEKTRGLARLRIASLVLYTFPGSPTVYYGDETGMEGFEDPFNRGPYPWGKEDKALRSWYMQLGQLRKEYSALRQGQFQWLSVDGPVLAFMRSDSTERLVTAVNASPRPQTVTIPWSSAGAYDLLARQELDAANGTLTMTLSGYGTALLV